jgi:hypothetical protein
MSWFQRSKYRQGALTESFPIALRRVPRSLFSRRSTRSTEVKCFVVDVTVLPNRNSPLRRRARPDNSPPDDDGTADLVGLVRSVDQMPELDASSIRTRNYTFYALCWPVGDDLVGFVRRANPTSALRPGNRYFQFGDTLRKLERPDLVLDGQIDMVVAGGHLAVFNQTAFNTLLANVGVALAAVPANLDAVGTELSKKIPLSTRATQAIEEFASTRPSVAQQLQVAHGETLITADQCLGSRSVRPTALKLELSAALIADVGRYVRFPDTPILNSAAASSRNLRHTACLSAD